MGVDLGPLPPSFASAFFAFIQSHISNSCISNLNRPFMDHDNQRGRRVIAKNSVFNLAGQILPMVVGVLTIPYIVKGLGTAQYGILSIAVMLLGYFNIFDLGLGRATVKFVAENLDPENIHKVPELIWTSLSLLVGLGIIGGIIAAFFVPVTITHLLKMPAELAGDARISLFVLCASMPVILGNNALRGVLEATQRFDLVNYVKVPSSVLFYLAAALAIPFGVHVGAIVVILVTIRLVSTLAYLLLCFRTIPELGKQFRISRASLGPLATFGGWIMVTNVTGPVFGYLERFMIASLLSVSLLTFYSTPYELVSKLLIIPMSVVPSLFPYFSYHGTKRSSEVSDVTSRTIKYLFLLLTPPSALFIFFARDIMHLWLGPQFADISATVLQITTVVCFVNAFAYIPYTSVQALGRPDLKAILDLVAVPAYFGIAWWLIKRDGINGAAFAKLLMTTADCVVLYIFAFKLKAFSVRDCFTGPLFRAISVSGALFAVIFALGYMHLRLSLTIPLIALCLVGYALLFWIFAVDAEDRTAIDALWKRAFGVLTGDRATPTMQLTATTRHRDLNQPVVEPLIEGVE
jgi:O-antigen/teichoic acid export membrane protein